MGRTKHTSICLVVSVVLSLTITESTHVERVPGLKCESWTSWSCKKKISVGPGRVHGTLTHSCLSVAAAVRKIVKLLEDAVRVVGDNGAKVERRTAAAGSGCKPCLTEVLMKVT